MKIGPRVIAGISERIESLLSDNQGRINNAFIRSEGGLSIGISVKIEPMTGDILGIQAGINFVADRVKVILDWRASENQPELFETAKSLAKDIIAEKAGTMSISFNGKKGDRSISKNPDPA